MVTAKVGQHFCNRQIKIRQLKEEEEKVESAEKFMEWTTVICGVHNANGKKPAPDLQIEFTILTV